MENVLCVPLLLLAEFLHRCGTAFGGIFRLRLYDRAQCRLILSLQLREHRSGVAMQSSHVLIEFSQRLACRKEAVFYCELKLTVLPAPGAILYHIPFVDFGTDVCDLIDELQIGPRVARLIPELRNKVVDG